MRCPKCASKELKRLNVISIGGYTSIKAQCIHCNHIFTINETDNSPKTGNNSKRIKQESRERQKSQKASERKKLQAEEAKRQRIETEKEKQKELELIKAREELKEKERIDNLRAEINYKLAQSLERSYHQKLYKAFQGQIPVSVLYKGNDSNTPKEGKPTIAPKEKNNINWEEVLSQPTNTGSDCSLSKLSPSSRQVL